MRVYEGDYAWEIERVLDPRTQLTSAWRYNIYCVRPNETVLASGEAKTREGAEKAGRQSLARLLRTERRARHKPAA